MPSRGEFKGKGTGSPSGAICRPAPTQDRSRHPHRQRPGRELPQYQELAWDLWRQGYSLYLIDHRGQGMSDRMLADKEKGYVDQFDDYVADLKQFHDEVIAQDKPAKLFLLAHSMGGPSRLGLGYLERWPNDIQAAVLSSP